MQIVIEISDIAYSNIKKLVSLNCGICTDIEKAIAKGMPLPKGHDDLIDRKELLKQSYRIDDSATLSTRDVVNAEEIYDAPAIIPATKEVEKELAESIIALIPHLPTESDKAKIQTATEEGE